MKTGMNLLLWATHVTEEHFPLISTLRATGFDGVEIPIFEGDASHYKKIQAELFKNGLVFNRGDGGWTGTQSNQPRRQRSQGGAGSNQMGD